MNNVDALARSGSNKRMHGRAVCVQLQRSEPSTKRAERDGPNRAGVAPREFRWSGADSERQAGQALAAGCRSCSCGPLVWNSSRNPVSPKLMREFPRRRTRHSFECRSRLRASLPICGLLRSPPRLRSFVCLNLFKPWLRPSGRPPRSAAGVLPVRDGNSPIGVSTRRLTRPRYSVRRCAKARCNASTKGWISLFSSSTSARATSRQISGASRPRALARPPSFALAIVAGLSAAES